MALTSNASYTTRNRGGMTRYAYTIVTSGTIYKGSLVALNAAGTAQAAANDTSSQFVGIAEEQPSGTGDGTIKVTVINDLEVLLTLVTAITVGNTGDAVYISDDATLSVEATLGAEVGTLVEFVAANSGWVKLRAKALAAGT